MIIQRRDGQRPGRARWAGRHYCLTRGAVLRDGRRSFVDADPIAWAVLEHLSERYEARMAIQNGKGRSTAFEQFAMMRREFMEEPAWRALSPTAQALYPWLRLEWKGADFRNNGKIRLSVKRAAERL
ncbi:MAG: hypothetical protein AAGA97_10620 [Pseudomonadota bacterium]